MAAAAAAAAAADEQKSCFDAAKNWAASSLGVGATSFYICQMYVKTPMGLEPFEVRFFIGKKFTKFDLAVQQDIKNRSNLNFNPLYTHKSFDSPKFPCFQRII